MLNPSSEHRIAVVRTDNLGDHVLGSGLFAPLRRHYPHSRIAVVAPESVAGLYARCQWVDDIVSLPLPQYYLDDPVVGLQVAAQLRALDKFDLVVNPRFQDDWEGTAAICKVLAAPGARVLGFRQASSKLGGYEPNEYYNQLVDAPDTLHSAEYTVPMLEAALGTCDAPIAPELWFTAGDWAHVAHRLNLLSREFVAVGIGASYACKLPPPEIFHQILRQLARRSIRAVLVGTMTEHANAQALYADFPDRNMVSACGPLRLMEVQALLGHARLYVGPDAGPKHMAAAAGTPVLEISRVPEDYAAHRADAGKLWCAWNTRTWVVNPSRDAYERNYQKPGFYHRWIEGLDPRALENALEEALEFSLAE